MWSILRSATSPAGRKPGKLAAVIVVSRSAKERPFAERKAKSRDPQLDHLHRNGTPVQVALWRSGDHLSMSTSFPRAFHTLADELRLRFQDLAARRARETDQIVQLEWVHRGFREGLFSLD